MSFRSRLLRGTSPPPRDLLRFTALVHGALALYRDAGQLDVSAAVDLIHRHADPIDRAGFDPAVAHRLAGAALAAGGWRETAPGIWSRS